MCAPDFASLESGWANSHLLRAVIQMSSSLCGSNAGFSVFVPFGRTTATRKPVFAVCQGA